MPLTNTYIVTEKEKQATEQQRVEAQRATEQLRLQLANEQAAMAAESERIRVAAQATTTAMQESARSERHYQTQVFLNDRFAWFQREQSARLRYWLTWATVLVLVAGVVTGLHLMAQSWQRHDVRVSVQLPPIPRELQSRSLAAFIAHAEREGWAGWDIVEDEQGRTVGVRYLHNRPLMWRLLEDNHG